MNPFYTAGISIYGGAARLVSLGSPKVRHMLSGQKETIARLRTFREHLAPDGFDVWFHAASLGEFEQARPIIDALLAKDSSKRILLSFFSPSGYEVRCDYNPRVAVVYLPFDTPGNVDAFLDAARPRMAIFVKYEFWGNYLEKLKKRGIPTYIISAIFRPTQRFFKPWGGVFRKMLGNFEHLYVQDERSRRLLAGIGIENVTVAGDTRFDRVTAIRENRKAIAEIECFLSSGAKGGFKMVFGSSWDRDEAVYIPWLKAHPAVKAIIAPHEFDKNRLAEMRRRLGGSRTMLFSDFKEIYHRSPEEASKVAAKLSYLIVDCFGLLSSLYAYADVAYVGGGFGVSIHNINEAATYGIPVVFGPRHAKFKEASDLIACGGAFSIDSAKAFASAMEPLLDEKVRCKAGKAAGDYIAANIGASDIIMADLFPQIK